MYILLVIAFIVAYFVISYLKQNKFQHYMVKMISDINSRIGTAPVQWRYTKFTGRGYGYRGGEIVIEVFTADDQVGSRIIGSGYEINEISETRETNIISEHEALLKHQKFGLN